MMVLSALFCARLASAEDIVVRLVDVNSGAGERNCYVGLYLGNPRDRPLPASTKFIQTSADGRARFSLADPLPITVWVNVADEGCAWPCDRNTVVPVDEILHAGVMKGMTGDTDRAGVERCRPNYKKLEEITAKPGEILIFVKRISWLERLSRH
jgi:hypothetical protein